MRRVLPIVLALGLFAVLAWPSRRLDLLAMRELFRGAEALGIIRAGTNYWGQILGYNVPTHPDLLHALVRFLAALVAHAPALIVALTLHGRLWRWVAQAPPPVALETLAARLRALAARPGFALLAFALALTLTEDRLHSLIRTWVFQAGRAAGCAYEMVGVLVVGPEGPFFGGPAAPLFNGLWRHLPWLLPIVGAFVPALVVHHVLHRRACLAGAALRCSKCGYSLAGLAGPRCPECGRITATGLSGCHDGR